MPCPEVSAGSTPTLMSATRFDGLTEFRAGVCVFFDLFQAGVGVCGTDEIALSVLATVIGHQSEKGWTITDAGWMAMSRDRGTATQAIDQGYGLVCALDGTPDPRPGRRRRQPGARHRRAPRAAAERAFRTCRSAQGFAVLPNHACATAAQYDRYHVVRDGMVVAEWPRFGGW